jgi:hypothetical protein
MAGMQADQNWQRTNKISPLGYLKELCLKGLTLALVGRSQAPQTLAASQVVEKLSDPSRRSRMQ